MSRRSFQKRRRQARTRLPCRSRKLRPLLSEVMERGLFGAHAIIVGSGLFFLGKDEFPGHGKPPTNSASGQKRRVQEAAYTPFQRLLFEIVTPIARMVRRHWTPVDRNTLRRKRSRLEGRATASNRSSWRFSGATARASGRDYPAPFVLSCAGFIRFITGHKGRGKRDVVGQTIAD